MSEPQIPYYVVLHGAKKNVGDFLIRDRAKKLLASVRADRALVEFPRWQSLEDQRACLENARAIIGMGGPAIVENLYPDVYKLTPRLEELPCPIYLLGTGSKAFPPFDPIIRSFALSAASRRLLGRCAAISTRDHLTAELIEGAGFPRPRMTGCPAWYDLDFLGKPLNLPASPTRILFSTPQREVYVPQAVEVAIALRHRFPNAEIVAAFNRGWTEDEHTGSKESATLSRLERTLREHGFPTADLSYDLAKLERYAEFDVHVGYRLHSHILFASRRKPSYLIMEDSRALGHCRTLGLPELMGVATAPTAFLLPRGVPWRFQRAAVRLLRPHRPDGGIPSRVVGALERDLDTGFASLLGLDQKLDRHFQSMRAFLAALP